MQCNRPFLPYDRLSDLPPGIVENILTLLPIRDAVRTSILSRSWRHIWTSMPDLNFGQLWASDIIVKNCLLLHQAPLRNLSVRTTKGSKIISWMFVLSRRHVQQLRINLGIYQIHEINVIKSFPSYLFDCNKLTHLELTHCPKLNVPPNFEGFLYLKTLVLDNVAVLHIDRLISTSPLLDSITLRRFTAPDIALAISAPKLTHLYLHGQFKGVCLEKTPALLDLTLYLNPNVGVLTTHQRYSNLVKVFAGVPNLEKLTVEITDHSDPHEVNSNLWMKEYPFEHGFMRLKVIEVVNVNCVASDKEFVKFMLSNSPVLEEMKVRSHVKRKEISSRMLKQLLKLPRASVQAAIKFYHKGRQL